MSTSGFRLIAILYVVAMIVGGAIVSAVLPPLQAPDESMHFLHAAEIAGGSFFPQATSGVPGGPVDQGYIALANVDAVIRVPFHTEEKFDRRSLEIAESLRTQGRSEIVPNPTSFYFPTGYLAQAVGIRLAALFSDRVLIHLIAARIANAVAAALIVYLAIITFPAAALIFITVSVLPMSVCVMNSASQDALLVACSILFAALCLRLLCVAKQDEVPGPSEKRADNVRRYGLGAFAVVLLLALGRPTYLAFTAIPATALLLIDWRRYAVFAAISVIAVTALSLTYLVYVSRLGPLMAPPGTDMAAQLHGVLVNPKIFLRALWLTISSRIPNETIGIIGYGDSPLPPLVYPAARIVGGVAIAATALMFAMSNVRSSVLSGFWSSLTFVTVTVLAVVGSIALTGLETYLQVAPVGAETDVYLQGRYFIEYLAIVPCALLAPLLSARLGWRLGWVDRRLTNVVLPTMVVLLLCLTAASFTVMSTTIVDRYYLH